MYDYVPGKAAWMASALPVEGRQTEIPVVGNITEREVPTCSMVDSVNEVRGRIQGRWKSCAVINSHRIVLGLIGEEELQKDGNRTVEEVMDPAPTTLRPSYPIDQAAEYLKKSGMETILATALDGTLIGFLSRDKAEAAARRLKSD